MQEPVEHGRRESAVVVEDPHPVLVCFVRRDDRGTPLVASADYLEEQISPIECA
jgi:hypothetical protein